MPTENPESAAEWTPERIRSLREEYDETQTTFGLRIFATTPGTAQRKMSQLESGDIRVSAAIVKHLQRLDSGQ